MDTLSNGQQSKNIRRACMNMLARRDQSQKELYQKLVKKFPEKHLIQAVIDQLELDGLQSDKIFAEGYVRFRSAKGYGPERIFMELVQKGVAESQAHQSIREQEIDWLGLLERQYEKKFQSRKPISIEDKTQYTRFLVYRGFSQQAVNLLLS